MSLVFHSLLGDQFLSTLNGVVRHSDRSRIITAAERRVQSLEIRLGKHLPFSTPVDDRRTESLCDIHRRGVELGLLTSEVVVRVEGESFRRTGDWSSRLEVEINFSHRRIDDFVQSAIRGPVEFVEIGFSIKNPSSGLDDSRRGAVVDAGLVCSKFLGSRRAGISCNKNRCHGENG